jgi:VWFA-related protein
LTRQRLLKGVRVKSPLGLALILVALCAFTSSSQQPQEPGPPPLFRVEIDAVEIDALVTNADGNPVTDLTADDFEVFEGDRRQTITSFAQVNIPTTVDEQSRVASDRIEPDVQRNDSTEGRLYVIAFGDVDRSLALRTRNFLRQFIQEYFGVEDRAAVVSLGRSRRADAQDFTSNRRLLLNAIDRFTGDFVDPPNYDATTTLPPEFQDFVKETGVAVPSVAQDMALELITRASSTMGALRQLAEFMATIGGRRKAVLFISTGIPVNMFTVIDNPRVAMSVAAEQAREAVRAAMLGNVTMYTIDPRGLTTGGTPAAVQNAQPRGQFGAELAAADSLRALADVTGGFALADSNNFAGAFDRIVRENSAYYVLGYQSTNNRRDGGYRRIRVRVARPGVRVKTRDGYLAPTNRSQRPDRPRIVADVSPAIADALASPIGISTLPMRFVAAPYRQDGRTAAVAVAVEFDLAGLELPERDGVFRGQLEIVHAVTTANGQVLPGDRHYADLALSPETYEQVRQHGIRVLLEPKLPAGRYQVRVAAGLLGNRSGSIVADLVVPDFSRQPLTMAGLSLTSATAEDALTIRLAEPLGDVLPGAITAAREFDTHDTLTVYTEVYENGQSTPPHTVALRAELRALDGRVLAMITEERSSVEIGGRSGADGFLAEIPLRDVGAGLYVVHVEAQTNIGDRPRVTRDIPIRVR